MITSSILQRSVSPDIEHDFILAYRAQEIWQLFPRDDDPTPRFNLNVITAKATSLLETGTCGRFGSLGQLLSDSTPALRLWNLYQKFEYFIDGYTARAIAALYAGPSNSEPPPPSVTEATRLKRAFFRAEIYNFLFHLTLLTHQHNLGDADTIADPASRYLYAFAPWQSEEICCVVQFYLNLVEELCDKMDEDLVTTIKAREASYSPPTYMHTETCELADLLTIYDLAWYNDSY
ncbi:hypothetical protein BJX63DRAFT_433894 [Aspergillus granulosus]|uniref:Uncharacterized protein n=1 Tax=Aspergillus granulosus TaxID=176169 RepID=A0ABR4H5P3_9EURO